MLQKLDNIIYYYWYSAFGPVWAETRAQSGDWYGSGTLHPGQVPTYQNIFEFFSWPPAS